MTIAAPNRVNDKLTEFYPLQKEELLKLYQMDLIKSAAYVHFALRLENPFCDRPIEIIIKEFAFRWSIPEKSLYRAIARLKELKVLDIKSGKLVVAWVEPEPEPEPEPENNTNDLDNPESENEFLEVRKDSQSCEPILRSEKKFSEVRKNSQSCENRSPKTPPDKEHRSPQTLQTYSDFIRSLSEGEREDFFNFVRKKTENLEKPINDLEAWLASKNAAKQNRWEIYYKNYQEEKKYENIKTTRQGNKSGKLSPSQVQRAIAEFKKQRQINQPVDEPENIDSEEHRQREAEFNKLLDNPPEREVRKSPAQQRREAIASIKRQQHELDLERKRKNAERQRQQELDEPDPEKRKEKMIRETEEFLRNRNQQNPEIGEENKDYE